jgi:hypothetical protein
VNAGIVLQETTTALPNPYLIACNDGLPISIDATQVLQFKLRFEVKTENKNKPADHIYLPTL